MPIQIVGLRMGHWIDLLTLTTIPGSFLLALMCWRQWSLKSSSRKSLIPEGPSGKLWARKLAMHLFSGLGEDCQEDQSFWHSPGSRALQFARQGTLCWVLHCLVWLWPSSQGIQKVRPQDGDCEAWAWAPHKCFRVGGISVSRELGQRDQGQSLQVGQISHG